MIDREKGSYYRWENLIETLLADLRYAARQLHNNPSFAATAMLILGLGIGATTAIFSAVSPILFQPLPYPHSDRVMMIFEQRDGGSRLPSFGTMKGSPSAATRSMQWL